MNPHCIPDHTLSHLCSRTKTILSSPQYLSWQEMGLQHLIFLPVVETQRQGKGDRHIIHLAWKAGLLAVCKAKPKHNVLKGKVPLLLQSQDWGHLVRAALTLSEEPNLIPTPETSFLPVNKKNNPQKVTAAWLFPLQLSQSLKVLMFSIKGQETRNSMLDTFLLLF